MLQTRSSTKRGIAQVSADGAIEDPNDRGEQLAKPGLQVSDDSCSVESPDENRPSSSTDEDRGELCVPVGNTGHEVPREVLVDRLVGWQNKYGTAVGWSEDKIQYNVKNLKHFLNIFYESGNSDQYSMLKAYEALNDECRYTACHGFCHVTWSSLRPDEQDKLRGWAPNAEQLMVSSTGREALFTAWIWHILVDKVFSADPSTKWEAANDTRPRAAAWHHVAQAMSILQKFDCQEWDAEPNGGFATKYHIWRALSAELSRRASGEPGTLPREYGAQLIKDELGHLMDTEKVALTLEHLSDSATNLDFLLMSRSVKTEFRWHRKQDPPTGFRFTKALDEGEYYKPMLENVLHLTFSLEPDPDFEGAPVELVSSPGIASIGRHFQEPWNHTRWDQCSWLAPMTTVVGNIPGPDPVYKPPTEAELKRSLDFMAKFIGERPKSIFDKPKPPGGV